MRKIISILLLITIMLGLFSGCGIPEPEETEPVLTEEPTTEPTESTTEPHQGEKELTHQDIIDHLNRYATENNESFRVSDLKEIPQDEPGRSCFTFKYMDSVMQITVWETDGVADGISVIVLPGKLREGLSNSGEYTDEELAVSCKGLAVLPVVPCEPDMNTTECLNWHGKQMDATMYVEDVFLKFKYQGEQWDYSLSIHTLSLMLTATKLSDGTPVPTEPVKPPENTETGKLTRDGIISYLNTYADQQGLDHVSDIATVPSEYVGKIRYQFDFFDGQLHVMLDEQDGVVDQVAAYVELSSIQGSQSQTDKAAIATGLALLPVLPCEAGMDSEECRKWHYGKIAEVLQEYDAFLTSDYSTDQWEYRCVVDPQGVMMNARSLSAQWQWVDEVDSPEEPPAEPEVTDKPNTSGNSETTTPSKTPEPTTPAKVPETTAPTKAPETTQPTQRPSAPQEPTECPHSFTTATCTEASFCEHCGELNSPALGHSYSEATCTQPQICTVCGAEGNEPRGHRWEPITETVYHEEQGHYEDVQEPYRVNKYQCYACSHQSDSLDQYYSHFDSVHGSSAHYQMVRDMYEIVDGWEYETVTKWIVDQEAYEETVTTGYKCTDCGVPRE